MLLLPRSRRSHTHHLWWRSGHARTLSRRLSLCRERTLTCCKVRSFWWHRKWQQLTPSVITGHSFSDQLRVHASCPRAARAPQVWAQPLLQRHGRTPVLAAPATVLCGARAPNTRRPNKIMEVQHSASWASRRAHGGRGHVRRACQRPAQCASVCAISPGTWTRTRCACTLRLIVHCKGPTRCLRRTPPHPPLPLGMVPTPSPPAPDTDSTQPPCQNIHTLHDEGDT